MRPADAWRSRFAGRGPQRALRSWLTEPGSLTARCQRHAADFRVRLLRQDKGRPLADEEGPRGLVRVREVVLECDGVPVIFAHTTLSTATGGRLTRWLARLGNRSLGSLLFAYPGFQRGAIEFRRLDAGIRSTAASPASGRSGNSSGRAARGIASGDRRCWSPRSSCRRSPGLG